MTFNMKEYKKIYHMEHLDAVKAYRKEYYKNNKENIKKARRTRYYQSRKKMRILWNKSQKKCRRALKIEVFKYYSPELKCQNPQCLVVNGCNDIRCLTIDHINGNGSRHRKSLKENHRMGANFYRWLRFNKYPEGYQVLCMNCQFVKRYEKGEW